MADKVLILEGWHLDNDGKPPYVARDNVTNKELPVRKYIDVGTGESVYMVVHNGGLETFHIPQKLGPIETEQGKVWNDGWAKALGFTGKFHPAMYRGITDINKAEIKNMTIHVSGPDKVEPKEAQIREL